MKYIFTIATNVYTEYFENFKNSINNFYPNEDKTLIVFSNKLQEYNNFQIDKTLIKIINIPNLLYSSILLNKFNFVIWYCENNIKEDQLIYFFDIDTWFYNDNEYALNYLDETINEHKDLVIFSNHPYNLSSKKKQIPLYVHGKIYNPNYLEPIYSNVFDDYSFSNYKLLYKDCITSFFVGSINSIIKLNNKYTNYYRQFLHNDRVIPQYCDEDIVNYIWLKQLINESDNEYIYVTDENIINMYQDISNKEYSKDISLDDDDIKYLICNQKYDVDKKLITK